MFTVATPPSIWWLIADLASPRPVCAFLIGRRPGTMLTHALGFSASGAAASASHNTHASTASAGQCLVRMLHA